MARYLFIVARDQPELGAHLAREFSGEAGVHVVLDRRCSDRRQRAAPEAPSAPVKDEPRSARSHRHALADVTDRILRREQQDVSRGIEKLLKKGTLEDLPTWLEVFYKEHRDWAAK